MDPISGPPFRRRGGPPRWGPPAARPASSWTGPGCRGRWRA
jgi:hypothetical protein